MLRKEEKLSEVRSMTSSEAESRRRRAEGSVFGVMLFIGRFRFRMDPICS